MDFFYLALWAAAAIAGLYLVAPLLHDGWDAGDRRDLLMAAATPPGALSTDFAALPTLAARTATTTRKQLIIAIVAFAISFIGVIEVLRSLM
jgi:hypothetical protein